MPATRRDADALRSSVRRLRSELGAPVVFAGLVHDGVARLSETVGTTTGRIQGLGIHARYGLGGRVMVENRPRLVADYGASRDITHDYDRQVLGEGIVSLLAVPVDVLGAVRGVVYAGSRGTQRLGRAAAVAAGGIAAGLAEEIRVRDEVDRRLADVAPAIDGRDAQETTTLREVWAEVRDIADRSADPVATERLRELERRLSPRPSGTAVLSRREVDVLALVALGCGNAEISERLDVGVETVRSYLRNAMRKLGVHSRLEAVVVARRLGELL